jgi:hypothetical protein
MRRLAVATLLAGCPSTPPPACITVDTNCAAGYQPTFDNVYNNTIKSSCSGDKSSCHKAPGMDGLAFPDEPTAYTNLLMPSGRDPSRMRVVPGNAACSLMIVRTHSPGTDYQMPPGQALLPEARCAIAQWVQCGALGPGSGSGCM